MLPLPHSSSRYVLLFECQHGRLRDLRALDEAWDVRQADRLRPADLRQQPPPVAFAPVRGPDQRLQRRVLVLLARSVERQEALDRDGQHGERRAASRRRLLRVLRQLAQVLRRTVGAVRTVGIPVVDWYGRIQFVDERDERSASLALPGLVRIQEDRCDFGALTRELVAALADLAERGPQLVQGGLKLHGVGRACRAHSGFSFGATEAVKASIPARSVGMRAASA